MIKARDLIKKERKDMYAANNDDNYNKESQSLWAVALFKAHSLYDNKYGLYESVKQYKKAIKLAKRLRREFLKGEKLKPVFSDNSVIITVDYDFSEYETFEDISKKNQSRYILF